MRHVNPAPQAEPIRPLSDGETVSGRLGNIRYKVTITAFAVYLHYRGSPDDLLAAGAVEPCMTIAGKPGPKRVDSAGDRFYRKRRGAKLEVSRNISDPTRARILPGVPKTLSHPVIDWLKKHRREVYVQRRQTTCGEGEWVTYCGTPQALRAAGHHQTRIRPFSGLLGGEFFATEPVYQSFARTTSEADFERFAELFPNLECQELLRKPLQVTFRGPRADVLRSGIVLEEMLASIPEGTFGKFRSGSRSIFVRPNPVLATAADQIRVTVCDSDAAFTTVDAALRGSRFRKWVQLVEREPIEKPLYCRAPMSLIVDNTRSAMPVA